MRSYWNFLLFNLCLQLFVIANCFADLSAEQQLEFFESRIRPVLVEHCYACHNAAKSAEGSLELDHRSGLRKGGDGGKIVIPGDPPSSRLIAILRHEVPGMKMPQGGAKLEKGVIADFEKWIAMGAPDPRDQPPTIEEIEKATSWESVVQKRKEWWSFQPIQNAEPPQLKDNLWSNHSVDRFILEKLRLQQLEPNEKADARTLVRRLYFALIGLPPTAEESDKWSSAIAEPKGFQALVEHLLSSIHFGERWARHWMDWTRYADSHGSEGDPPIENAWLYRDYLIRALNADVPYDQLVREHIAGDLLEQPRINSTLGINESIVGTAHWRMVFHGFSPTDALDEKTRFIDDQINVFSKAFLGLTVSCARCHDHKFDAISQKDYYAIAGILGSCRPGRSAIDLQDKLDLNRKRLKGLKPQIKEAIATSWLTSLPTLQNRLLTEESLWNKAKSDADALHGWALLQKELGEGTSVTEAWKRLLLAWKQKREHRSVDESREPLERWHLGNAKDFATWHRTGNGLQDELPATAGEFAVASQGDAALVGIYPSGVYSHRLSAKHPARLTSSDIQIDGKFDLWLRVLGDGDATTRFVVHDYPRRGVVFPTTDLKPQWEWVKIDLSYWEGDKIHIELTTALDAPLLVKNVARSWFGVREALIVPQGKVPPSESFELLDAWIDAFEKSQPKALDEAAASFAKTIGDAIQAWRTNTLSDSQAILLDACMKQGLLPNDTEGFAEAGSLLKEYRQLEEEIPVATRVPTLEETVGREQAIYIRGDHKNRGDNVSRGFLDAIRSGPYSTTQSGRIELAEDLLRQDNPLTRRVFVNRLWHHLFGRGIVATPDNFGRLGQAPTHPELLDHLASELLAQGGSIKQMIRYLITSKTWQMDSRPSAESQKRDPSNQFWSHAQIRRLEAEAIRDSLLTVSGNLDREAYGEPVKGNSQRRSIYIKAQRNALDPFLRAFDFPEPFSAVGSRDVTNVPAQSLTLMNDAQVVSMGSAWAKRLHAVKTLTNEERIAKMFLEALGRPPSSAEIARSQSYLESVTAKQNAIAEEVANLQRQIDERRSSIDEVLELARSQLIAESTSSVDSSDTSSPEPYAQWNFTEGLNDLVGDAHPKLHNEAQIGKDGLIVTKLGYASTEPLKQSLKAKTLEAWVQLPELKQRGGGVMTIQSLDGKSFDSIVFAEKSPYQWVAGSNNFQRTQSFNGPNETDAANRPVHFAIVYHEDGQISGYRDGEPYGRPYQSDGPFEFKKGEAIVTFGVRHLPAAKNRMLSGSILRARLYDRALTAEEVQRSAKGKLTAFLEKRILEKLSNSQRAKLELDRQELARLERQWAERRPAVDLADENPMWTDLARALFTFKEFLFVK
jgi:Protein of unknown function (DUF1553)/Protein of unknown function (DUF1549)/Planctomycete cytochrome C/Concanavalin A-like lectin/glucanases superfamily